MGLLDDLAKCTGFDWDAGNLTKNWARHRVAGAECEQVFFNQPLWIVDDAKHSQHEPRGHAFGVTDEGRCLHITFTLRGEGTLIRVISARDMSAKERKWYASQSSSS